METKMNKLSVWLVAIAAAVLMAGCGDNVAPTDATSTTTTTTTTTPTTTTPPTTTTTTGGVTYTITLVPALTSLSAGGNTLVTATIYANGVVDTTQAVSINFTSTCVGQGKATIDSPVVSSAGVAVSTYKDIKCASVDTVAASVSLGGSTITASAQITVLPAALGSISFLSATPDHIGIKGVGLTEASTVKFQVLDVLGQTAIAGVYVSFVLDTTIGGITISPTTAQTDANGVVSTTVTSGTSPATVTVTARLDSNTSIQTQSSGLVISTGVSDQYRFSIASDKLNLEAWGYDGEVANLTVRASDHYGNPVPDGAAVLFRTEGGGQVVSSCTLVGGVCSVTWTSVNSSSTPADGRVTVLATMTGEEGFVDTNGDNKYALGETYGNMPEAFLDKDEDGMFNNLDEYRDFNTNGTYDGADGGYNGVLCASGCGTGTSIDVRDDLVLVMSSSGLAVLIDGSTSASVIDVSLGSKTVPLEICDVNGNVPPAGTKLTVKTDNGKATLLGGDTMLNSSGPGCWLTAVSVSTDSTSSTGGTLTVEAVTPKSVKSIGVATVND